LKISKPSRSGGRYPWGWPRFCRIKLSWTSNQMSTTTRKNPKLRPIQPVSIRAPLRLMHEILQLVGFRIPVLPVFADFIPSLQPVVSNHSFRVEITSATLMVLPFSLPNDSRLQPPWIS
jgi:hypothetical protein